MADFIELKFEGGMTELVNTNSIDSVHVHEGYTIIVYSKYSSSGAISGRVLNSYDEIKGKLTQ